MNMLRIDLTVLTDLAASMFAACFMILLIFLSLAQQADAPQSRPIEASKELNLVTRQVPAPGGLVDLLHDHASTVGTSIDIFADRIEMRTGAGRTTLRGSAIGPAVVTAQDPIRLYVFSNALYHDVAVVLGERAVTEMSVPRALAAGGSWQPEFLALDAERAALPVFRQRLAQLLEGGTEQGAAAGAGGTPASSSVTALVQRIAAALAAIAALGFPLLGLGAVVLIERRRLRSGQSIPAGEQSLEP